ncbi:hypothetical protein NPIL_320401 [Nephila pilipes]|uniref:Uncharacterized protein n=1 Tax=Nephila pilipes TaxID=299642 RepID=A0A8X6R4K6_NEPPI|nr:hypothetical protein NPIL_320401 [Nephila pilipes]
MPQKQFAFGEHANDQQPVDNLDVNLCTLREEEGRCLNTTQKEKLVAVLKKRLENTKIMNCCWQLFQALAFQWEQNMRFILSLTGYSPTGDSNVE